MQVALRVVRAALMEKYPNLALKHEPALPLAAIVAHLRQHFPEVDFYNHFPSSSMRPDGGVLSVTSNNGESHIILIGEVKNQGTNDLRAVEGKAKQAQGNAIERLGKNVIGFRAAMLTEAIFPFVCFGYGCDFLPDSSILDRVSTIAMFGKLNCVHLHRQGPNGEFNRGSFFFRGEKWTPEEMAEIMLDIADRSVLYYLSKHGPAAFNTQIAAV